MAEVFRQSSDVDVRELMERAEQDERPLVFRALIEDVVGIVHPDIQEVFDPREEWGATAFVGALNAGRDLRVWFGDVSVTHFGAREQRNADEVLKAAMEAAETRGYRLRSWTFCIADDLDAASLKRWNSWANKLQKSSGTSIRLWSASSFRRRLMSRDGASLREHYFSKPDDEEDSNPPVRPLQDLSDPSRYEDALFIRQMREAKLPETFAAREAFFNAEILSREVEDKGDRREAEQLRSWRIRVQATWDRAFNAACQASAERVPVGLYSSVMEAIESGHGKDAEALRASVLHGTGIMHQAVDNSRAGWVRDWREIASDHSMSRVRLAASSGGDEDA